MASSPLPAAATFDLNLEGITGQIKQVCTVEVLGVLEEADLAAALQSTRASAAPADNDPIDLTRIRERHHHVARLIAQGLSQTLVASITSYTESYLSIMLQAPAMEELIGFYRGRYLPAHEVMVERLRAVGGKAVEELDRRLENEAADLSTSDLTAIGKLALDRSGHGPTSSQHIIKEDHLFDHAALQQKNKEARERSASRIIESPAAPALPSPQPAEKDLGDAGSE